MRRTLGAVEVSSWALWTPAEAAAAAHLLPNGTSADVPGGGEVAPLLDPGPVLLDLLKSFHEDPQAVIHRSVRRLGEPVVGSVSAVVEI